MKTRCKKCFSINKQSAMQGTSYLSTLLVILIPKCPLCIMAYSSAITMCGTQDLYMNSNNWVSYLPLMLSSVIIVMIVMNNRGIRTFFSMVIASAGFLMILLTHQLIITDIYYDLGTILLILAIWTNSNYMAFVAGLKNIFNNQKWSWQK